MNHLDKLEAEAIYIMREVAAECEKPVMLYSIGKDSSVMLHLALKAFYPEKPPFPFLHVDTTWKFREMIKNKKPISFDALRQEMNVTATGENIPPIIPKLKTNINVFCQSFIYCFSFSTHKVEINTVKINPK